LPSAYFDCLRVNLVHLVRFVQRHLKVDVFSVEVEESSLFFSNSRGSPILRVSPVYTSVGASLNTSTLNKERAD